MTFRKVKDQMKKAGTGFLATTNGQRPDVRPMAAYAWFGGELWMACGTKSAKIADIRKKPAVAFCCMAKDFSTVRINGRCRVSDAKADKKRMFASHKWMKNYFGGITDPSWTVLKIRPDRLRYMPATDLKTYEIKI